MKMIENYTVRLIVLCTAIICILSSGCTINTSEIPLSSQPQVVSRPVNEPAWPPHSIHWDYSKVKYELTTNAVYGSTEDFKQWQKDPKKSIISDAESVVKPTRATFQSTTTRKESNAIVEELTYKIRNPFVSGSIDYTVAVWKPKNSNGYEFPIVAFDGHGDCDGDCIGIPPKRIFEKDGFGHKLVDLGYTVIGFPTAIHKPFQTLGRNIDYPIIWAGLAKSVLDTGTIFEKANHPYIALGNAIGGLTALSLSIIDSRSLATITNGAFFPLELTRRDYRIKGHPFCHDFRRFYTYTTIYSLLFPRPLMIQVGVHDGLWLGNGSVPPSSWFSGLKRGATVDETLGARMILETLWQKGGGLFDFNEHSQGHEDLQPTLVDEFLNSATISQILTPGE